MRTAKEYRKALDILHANIKTLESRITFFDILDDRYPGDHEILRVLITSENSLQDLKDEYYELAQDYLAHYEE